MHEQNTRVLEPCTIVSKYCFSSLSFIYLYLIFILILSHVWAEYPGIRALHHCVKILFFLLYWVFLFILLSIILSHAWAEYLGIRALHTTVSKYYFSSLIHIYSRSFTFSHVFWKGNFENMQDIPFFFLHNFDTFEYQDRNVCVSILVN